MKYLSKIGFLHSLLNRQYPIFLRFFISLAYFFICLIISFDYKLSFLFFKRVLLRNDLKSESRRLVWIIKKKSSIIADPTDLMFDFCNGLNLQEFAILKSNFLKSINSSENEYSDIDLLKIFAYEINYFKDYKSKGIPFEKFKAQYYKVKKSLNHKKISRNNLISKINKRKFSKKTRGISAKKAQKVLIDINHLFKKNNFEWFPISGTFLGFIRQNSFLRHDIDIDIGLMSNKISFEKLKNVLEKSHIFEISKIEYQRSFFNKNDYLNRPTFARVIHKNGINVDLYLHFKEGDFIYHGTSSILWKNNPFDLCNFKIYGLNIKVPSNSDLYLSETYGDWVNEKINYNFHRDMLSVRGAQNYLGLEYLLRRKLYCGKVSGEQISMLEELMLK